MMKKHFRILFVCCLSLLSTLTNSVAQTVVDSFRNALKTKTTYDAQITAYNDFAGKMLLRDFEAVIETGNPGLKLAEQHDDIRSQGLLTRWIGEAYYFHGDYSMAANSLYRSAKLLETLPPGDPLGRTYNAIAKLYRKTRDLTQSLANYDKAMAIYRNMNDSAGMSMIYNESGVVFEYRGDYKEAIARYTASLRLDELRKDTFGICYALSNLSGVYTLQKKFPEAEAQLLQSLQLRKNMRDSFSLALNYSDLAVTVLAAGQPRRAALYVDSSKALAEKLGYPELLSNNFETLGNIAEKEGNYAAALNYFKKRTSLRDSIFSLAKTNQIQELSARYETEKKERLISEQKNKITQQNILIAAVAVFILLAALLAYTQYRRFQWRQEAKTQARILREQELAAKAVMDAEEGERKRIATDLHDGVGQIMSAARMNLSAFRERAAFATPEELMSFDNILSLVDSGCKEVRTVSHNMMPTVLDNKNLPDAVREFVNKIDRKAIEVHVFSEGFDERSDGSDMAPVLYRVIQECLNNVIKHARATVADISLIRDEAEISVTIEDNGKGFDASDASKFNGIGLKNIRTRMEYLKGTVEYETAPGKGTVVMLHAPV